jgi:hypothetical protein
MVELEQETKDKLWSKRGREEDDQISPRDRSRTDRHRDLEKKKKKEYQNLLEWVSLWPQVTHN